MIVAWNVRGLNKMGKLKEISSRLLQLDPMIIVLIETRVKKSKAINIRKKLRFKGMYLDNYVDHDNGRIWLCWDNNRIDLKFVHSSSQLVHCGVYGLDGIFRYWLTAIYALNKLENRRSLWKDIVTLHSHQQGPWCLIGDYNNVTKAQDRIGGKMVTEAEYTDFSDMLEQTGLAKMDSQGDYFTWSNKHVEGTIYSRIDRVMANVSWFQNNLDVNLHIMPPNVSDHALLWLQHRDRVILKKIPLQIH